MYYNNRHPVRPQGGGYGQQQLRPQQQQYGQQQHLHPQRAGQHGQQQQQPGQESIGGMLSNFSKALGKSQRPFFGVRPRHFFPFE